MTARFAWILPSTLAPAQHSLSLAPAQHSLSLSLACNLLIESYSHLPINLAVSLLAKFGVLKCRQQAIFFLILELCSVQVGSCPALSLEFRLILIVGVFTLFPPCLEGSKDQQNHDSQIMSNWYPMTLSQVFQPCSSILILFWHALVTSLARGIN